MNEDVGKLIGSGFRIWRQNLNLCVPFALAAVFFLVVAIPFVAGVAYMFAAAPEPGTISSPKELISWIEPSLAGLALGFLVFILIISLISSFFASGAITMAEQAIREGKTSTSIIWAAGRRHLLNMFVVSILTELIMLAGFVFLLPGVFFLVPSFLADAMANPQAWALLAVGILFLLVYLFVMALLLAIAPYILVIDSRGPIESIMASVGFFSHNKFDVFMIWIVVLAISLGLQMIGGSVSVGGNPSFQPLSLLTGIANMLVLSPLSAVWWARLYMSRTGRLENAGVKDPW